jgi:hypothetical protein
VDSVLQRCLSIDPRKTGGIGGDNMTFLLVMLDDLADVGGDSADAKAIPKTLAEGGNSKEASPKDTDAVAELASDAKDDISLADSKKSSSPSERNRPLKRSMTFKLGESLTV